MFGPGEHDLGAVLAHGVVGAVPGGHVLGLDRGLAPRDDHVVRPVPRGDRLEGRGPDLGGSHVLDTEAGADVVISFLWPHSWGQQTKLVTKTHFKPSNGNVSLIDFIVELPVRWKSSK